MNDWDLRGLMFGRFGGGSGGGIGMAMLVLFVVVGVEVSGCRTGPSEAPLASGASFLSIEEVASLEGIERVGFDVDDTLLFSTGAFSRGFESGHEYGSDGFWSVVNSSDDGNSLVKAAARAIVARYGTRGIEVFAVTARSPVAGRGLALYLNETLGIPVENVFFEPTNKTSRISELRFDVFFGDSDSDIRDAMDAGVRAIRFQRSEKSSYKNADGSLRKYHPGMYGEEIIRDSED